MNIFSLGEQGDYFLVGRTGQTFFRLANRASIFSSGEQGEHFFIGRTRRIFSVGQTGRTFLRWTNRANIFCRANSFSLGEHFIVGRTGRTVFRWANWANRANRVKYFADFIIVDIGFNSNDDIHRNFNSLFYVSFSLVSDPKK